MDENKPKNIFETAGKAKKPVPASSLTSVPKKIETTQQPQPQKVITPENLLNLHRDPEINEMLNKMYRMQEDLQTKLKQIYDANGISSNQIRNFLNNPGNFPPDVWQKIQMQRDALEKKIREVLPTYAKKTKTGHIAGMTSKERKSKTLGARKKWIPM